MSENRTKDLRGRQAKVGDICAVGITVGSSGGWLSIRQVVKVENGNVFFQEKRTGRVYAYRARSKYLILPKTYKDALSYEPFD